MDEVRGSKGSACVGELACAATLEEDGERREEDGQEVCDTGTRSQTSTGSA